MEKVILVLATLSLLQSLYSYVVASRTRGLLTMHLPVVTKADQNARNSFFISCIFGIFSMLLFLVSGLISDIGTFFVAIGSLYLIVEIIFVMKYSGKTA